jgi:hypothetical protein
LRNGLFGRASFGRLCLSAPEVLQWMNSCHHTSSTCVHHLSNSAATRASLSYMSRLKSTVVFLTRNKLANYCFSYLQTPQSKLLLTEDKVIREHVIACLTCLLSGLKVFQPEYPHLDRSRRVLKGLHGFHVYASEYWVGYILSVLASHDGLSQPERLSSIIHDLSKILDNLGESCNALDNKDNSTPSEKSLDLLKVHKGLYANALAALAARPRKGFGDESEEGGISACLFDLFTVLTCTSRLCYGFN